MLHPSFFVALHYNHDWMKHLAYLVAGFILFSVLLYACSTGVCFEDTEPKVIVNMYTDGTETLKKCDSIKVIGHGAKDTLLVDEESVSSFSFSLDPLNNESTFYFNLNDKTDTVTLTYNNYPHVISPECGYTIYNDILTVKVNNKNEEHHIIVNITIDNKSVTLNGERNLRLFY